MKIIYSIIVVTLLMSIGACREESRATKLEEISEDNVFKGYATSIEKRKALNRQYKMLQISADKNMKDKAYKL